MTNIEKIRQEIMKMREQAALSAVGNHTDWLESRIDTCGDILAFIDSLPEEIPPYVTGFKGDPDPPGISDVEQTGKDLALTLKDMVLLRTLFDATDANQSIGALTVQPMTREYYEYLLREFNEQRKK